MITKARFRGTTARRLHPAFWLALCALAAGGSLAGWRTAAAQEPPLELSSADELYDLVGPIALYPDDLVAIVLPASTYPLQIVQAARFLEDRERDSSLQPDEEWDESIVALLNYPEVVELMNDDLDWTYDLGTAVLNQRADVLSAIQDFRDEAYAAGNLRSDDRQTVVREDDTIVIKPANPQVIYVPYYEPREVVVYQTVPVYRYYPRRYAVYYYPYPAHYAFDVGFFWGVRSWYSIGWHTHHVHLYDWHYQGHPYFGWRYYDPFYVHNHVYVNINVNRDRDYIWQPRHRYGGRPVVRGSEGRVYTADRAPRRGVLDSNAAAARSREGSVYRTQQGAARVQQGAAGARTTESVAPRRGVPSTAYRSRAAQTTERATQGAERASQAARARAPSASGSVQAQGRQQPATSRGTYRSGGGMSQALERSRVIAPASRESRTGTSVSPRAVQPSTGMPREATRSAPPPRASESAPRAPSHGGGVGAQRSDSGASRGNSGGGSYRGGSGSTRAAHPAARNSAGR